MPRLQGVPWFLTEFQLAWTITEQLSKHIRQAWSTTFSRRCSRKPTHQVSSHRLQLLPVIAMLPKLSIASLGLLISTVSAACSAEERVRTSLLVATGAAVLFLSSYDLANHMYCSIQHQTTVGRRRSIQTCESSGSVAKSCINRSQRSMSGPVGRSGRCWCVYGYDVSLVCRTTVSAIS